MSCGSSEELSNGSASDCSWFIYHVFNHFGLMSDWAKSTTWGAGGVPNTTRVSGGISQAQPGDVLFWDEGGGAGHVAMYIGNNQAVACNGYFTSEYRSQHNGHDGDVEITGYQTTIGRDPDSIWRMKGINDI